ARGIEVREVGLRRGKPGKSHDYSYRVAGAQRAVRGRTLGVEYTHAAIRSQLELKAAGREIERSMGPQRSGSPVPLPLSQQHLSEEEQRELEQLRSAVEALAEEGRKGRAGERRPFEEMIAEIRRSEGLPDPEEP